jgi:hypothetical protein
MCHGRSSRAPTLAWLLTLALGDPAAANALSRTPAFILFSAISPRSAIERGITSVLFSMSFGSTIDPVSVATLPPIFVMRKSFGAKSWFIRMQP